MLPWFPYPLYLHTPFISLSHLLPYPLFSILSSCVHIPLFFIVAVYPCSLCAPWVYAEQQMTLREDLCFYRISDLDLDFPSESLRCSACLLLWCKVGGSFECPVPMAFRKTNSRTQKGSLVWMMRNGRVAHRGITPTPTPSVAWRAGGGTYNASITFARGTRAQPRAMSPPEVV